MASIRFAVDETFHIVWCVRYGRQGMYLHAIGDGASGNRVTAEMAEHRFKTSGFRTFPLPLLFGSRAITTGRRSWNCWTAALHAWRRGVLYF